MGWVTQCSLGSLGGLSVGDTGRRGQAGPTTTTARRSIPWVLVAASHAEQTDRPVSRRRVGLRVLALGLAVAVAVTFAAGLVARQIAQSVAIDNAVQITRVLAIDVVEPALRDGVATGDEEDLARLAVVFQNRVLTSDIARVKLWTPDGTIVYSDDPRLIGRVFRLPADERRSFESNGTYAEISDLNDPDNVYERGNDQLLEVHRVVRTPDGTRMLFEVYFDYGAVTAQQNALWLRFAAVISGSLLLFMVALAPIIRGLIRSLERGRAQREVLLQRAIDASDTERRRIAALLHDGPVQELVGASYFIGAASMGVAGTDAERTLDDAERTVRATVDTLRALLLDIYPPALTEAGLSAALDVLTISAAGRGTTVIVDVPPALRFAERTEQLLFRVARETIANGVKHAEGTPVTVSLALVHHRIVLTVRDDGPGFDAESLIAHPENEHFGLRLLRDAVVDSGLDATLEVQSAIGAGTIWRLTVHD